MDSIAPFAGDGRGERVLLFEKLTHVAVQLGGVTLWRVEIPLDPGR